MGYTPVMVFDVADLQTSLTRCLTLGAQMDGAVQYSLDGNKVGEGEGARGGKAVVLLWPDHHALPPSKPMQVASLRAPDGHMIGLVEQVEQ